MDYYKELEIDKNSSSQEIRSAYKKLALKWHPDRNKENKQEAEDKFKKISEAYQVLSDKDKKSRYDNYGNVEHYQFTNPDEIFKTFFQDIPLEYIELANTFLLQFINSPECEITLKIFSNMPNKENIIKVLEIFQKDFPEETQKTLQKYINRLREKENKKNDIIDLATNYAFNFFNNKMKVTKKSIKKKISKNNHLITNDDYFENKKNDIEFNVNCTLEDIYNKVEKEIIISRINRNSSNKKSKKKSIFGNYDYYNEEKKLSFPANFRPILTFKNEGNLLPGNKKPGNVIIHINSKPHPLFKIINDYDIITERYISIYELYNGCIFTIDYFNNRKISIRANPNIFKNTIQKIENLGLPIPQTDEYGSLYIKFIVQYPNVKENNNKLLFDLFPPINTGIPDKINIQNYEEYLLNDNEDYTIEGKTDDLSSEED